MPEGRGISTGIGQGEAQVFQPAYSDYYKRLGAIGAKKKAGIQKGLAFDTKDLWDRDVPQFSEKAQGLRSWVVENNEALMKGDINTQAKFNELQQDIVNFVNASKGAKETTQKLMIEMGKNPDQWEQKSWDSLQEWSNPATNAGNFDTSGFMSNLRKVLDVDALADATANKLQLDVSKDKAFQDKFGNIQYERVQSVSDDLINRNAEQEWMQNKRLQEKMPLEEFTQMVADRSSIKRSEVVKQPMEGFGSRSKKKEASRRKELIFNIQGGDMSGLNELKQGVHGTHGTLTNVVYDTTGAEGVVRFSFNKGGEKQEISINIGKSNKGGYSDLNNFISGFKNQPSLSLEELGEAQAFKPGDAVKTDVIPETTPEIQSSIRILKNGDPDAGQEESNKLVGARLTITEDGKDKVKVVAKVVYDDGDVDITFKDGSTESYDSDDKEEAKLIEEMYKSKLEFFKDKKKGTTKNKYGI